MSVLVILHGPEAGRHISLAADPTILGRNADCTIPLTGKQVSRQHVRLHLEADRYFLQDLGSSNGTYVNGKRILAHQSIPIGEDDTFQVGPYLFAIRPAPSAAPPVSEPSHVVRETVSATSVNEKLFTQDPATKLQVVLEIAQQLSRTLDLDPLLEKLLEQLMKLFPQADRVMAILCEGDQLIVRAQRGKPGRDMAKVPFSKTIVRRALDEGVGLISEDVQSDKHYQTSHSITSLDLHSIICVPLINMEGKRHGVLQVDRFCKGFGFRVEDLHLLTALGMEVTVVLENVALHAERMREQRLLQELALAQDIQQGYLPDELVGFPNADFEIVGQVFSARQVAGDFYDFVKTPAGKLAFFLGDVSGKGMPAALYMIAVRTLCRHLIKDNDRPAPLLAKLNAELAADNPNCMFVTLVHGIYDPPTGRVVLASAGHHAPLLRRASGLVEDTPHKSGRLLGYSMESLQFPELNIELAPGDALWVFTDGLLEARAPDGHTMFGIDRVRQLLREDSPSLLDSTNAAKRAVERFTESAELQDDLTMLGLRRRPRV
jgi:serine phosphatase RsbU (regulator of sigma subunit)